MVDPSLPTDARPGSPEKLGLLAERAALGLPLHVKGDRRLPSQWVITVEAAYRPRVYRAHAEEPGVE